MQRSDKNQLTAAGVSAPRLVYAPDPEFTSQARTKNVAGTGGKRASEETTVEISYQP
jgi:hypothetical protein